MPDLLKSESIPNDTREHPRSEPDEAHPAELVPSKVLVGCITITFPTLSDVASHFPVVACRYAISSVHAS